MEQGMKPVNGLPVLLLPEDVGQKGLNWLSQWKSVKAELEGIHNMLCLGGLYTWYYASVQLMSSSKKKEYLIPSPSTG